MATAATPSTQAPERTSRPGLAPQRPAPRAGAGLKQGGVMGEAPRDPPRGRRRRWVPGAATPSAQPPPLTSRAGASAPAPPESPAAGRASGSTPRDRTVPRRQEDRSRPVFVARCREGSPRLPARDGGGGGCARAGTPRPPRPPGRSQRRGERARRRGVGAGDRAAELPRAGGQGSGGGGEAPGRAPVARDPESSLRGV